MGWDDRASLETVATVGLDAMSADACTDWVGIKRHGLVGDAWSETLGRLSTMLGSSEGRRLYDIGAGDGGFLAVAGERGFVPRGNEIAEAAVEVAATTRGITLDLGDISTIEVEDQDAITMWCVMAHVPDPDQLLTECYRRLRPGGVLFLQTPHRTVADSVALLVLRASGGRASRLVDRRIAHHHWLLETRRSMRATLERVGFEVAEVRPQARYSLCSEAYLRSIGVPVRARAPLGRVMDLLLRMPFVPRIVLDAYARKPAGGTARGEV